jgi:hypothetical protein
MTEIMNQTMGAFPGLSWLTAIIIAVICALLSARLPQVIIWGVVATVIFTFWRVVSDAVETRSLTNVGAIATDVVKGIQTNWMLVVIHLVVFIVGIGVLFLLKSVFRRG